MTHTSLTSLLTLLTATAAVAQEELRITDLDQPGLTWGQETEAGQAGIRYDERPGEHTLLMVHTTVDETVCGSIVAAGLTKALPSMVQPTKANWTLSDPELSNPDLTSLAAVQYAGFAPMVPPRRIAEHVDRFLSAGYPVGFGTANTAGETWVTRTVGSATVGAPADAADERNPWWHATWLGAQAGVPTFWTSGLGRESVLQAGHEFLQSDTTGLQLDDVAIGILNDLMDMELGFEVYVQAIHVKLPDPDGVVKVRFSRHVRIRRRSLGQNNGGWFQAKGPARHTPDPFDHTRRWYLAPLTDEMHVEFRRPVSSALQPRRITAYFPLASGGVQAVLQSPNPLNAHGEVLSPEKAIFVVPADAKQGGLVYFEDPVAPGVPLAPVGNAAGGGAVIVTYDLPAAPVPPSAN